MGRVEYSPHNKMKYSNSILFLCAFIQALVADSLEPIFSIDEDGDTSGIRNCEGDNILMCKRVDINFDADADQILVAFPGLADSTLTKISSEPSSMGSALVFEYENDQHDDAILTWDVENEQLTGTILLAEAETSEEQIELVLESCGEGCTVLMSINVTENTENTEETERIFDPDFANYFKDLTERLGDRSDNDAPSDRNCPTYVSLTVYVSDDLNAIYSDVSAYVRQQVDETNRVFSNSRTDVRFYVRCLRVQNMNENTNSLSYLNQVINANGGLTNSLRGSDMAYILTRRFSTDGACGRAGALDVTTTAYGNAPIAFSGRFCSTYTMAHELGHLFGAWHNREVLSFNAPGGYPMGQLIGNGPYRTVMAYRSSQHTMRIPYFSTPIFSINGDLLGSSTRDNRRRIRETRYAISRMGNGRSCSA